MSIPFLTAYYYTDQSLKSCVCKSNNGGIHSVIAILRLTDTKPSLKVQANGNTVTIRNDINVCWMRLIIKVSNDFRLRLVQLVYIVAPVLNLAVSHMHFRIG